MSIPEKLCIIAGNGAYPLLLAESAREQGVGEIYAAAFRGEADRSLRQRVDGMQWLPVGALDKLEQLIHDVGCSHAVMAGQITPTALFRARPDRRMLALLKSLPEKNAHTIFGAVCSELAKGGIEMLPASQFMEKHMPNAGLLSRRAPSAQEERDIQLGVEVAQTTSGLDIGQTVVIKEGTILAVEAFEGTDRTIRRAGKLGGPGAVVVKRAKPGHDMRFDIPVIGRRTLRSLKKAGACVLAVEAGRCILLEKEWLVNEADRLKIVFQVLPPPGIESDSGKSGEAPRG